MARQSQPQAKGTKTAFIRAQSPDVPATEVVARAKRAGIKLSAAFVYTTRYKARCGDGSKGSVEPGIRHAPAKRGPTRIVKDGRGPEEQLRAIALQIGTQRAYEVLQALETSYTAVA